MTKQQMARRIKDLERHVEDLETELQSVTDRILPVGWVSHPVGDTRLTGTLTTNADGLRYHPYVEHAKRGRGRSRFQSGYPHGLGKGHEWPVRYRPPGPGL